MELPTYGVGFGGSGFADDCETTRSSGLNFTHLPLIFSGRIHPLGVMLSRPYARAPLEAMMEPVH
jgi:hypothetical protein